VAKIVVLNMDGPEADVKDLSSEFEKHGGRELTSTLIYREMDPSIDPLGRESMLVISTGLLAGTSAPGFSRISVGGKSPLTGGIKEANVGGKAGFTLGQHDIRALMITGRPDDDVFYHVVISDDGIKFLDASDDKYLGNYELSRKLLREHGQGVAILSIGPAGVRGMPMASIADLDLQNYPSRHAARGGLGAVMGAKGIKSIIIHKPRRPRIDYVDYNKFKEIAMAWSKELKESRAGFSKLGTALIVGVSQMLKGLPTRNFSRGVFDGAEKIGADRLHEMIVERGGRFGLPCTPGCAIQCSNLVIGPNGNHATSSLEYETITLNGSNLMIDDLDAIARIDHECDDIGIDTIEFGGMAGVLMEAGRLKFGDAKGVHEVLGEIRKGSSDGLFYGQGTYRVGKKLGVKRIPAVKGQGFPAYDPRVYKGMGVTFVTSPMGADHTAGAAIYKRPGMDPDADYGDIFEKRGKLRLSFELQILIGACDMLGVCYFIGPNLQTIDKSARLINARYGWDMTVDDLIGKTKAFLKKELDFNERAGVGFKPNDMPEFIKNEDVPPTGHRWEFTDDDLKGFWNRLLD